ncbi:hypothetical protein ACFL3G_11450 [Planctomycetota bacterium]
MGWRGKFIFLLLVYFAGFATAVYHLGSQPTQATEQVDQQYESKSFTDFSASAVDSDRLLKTLNTSMHKLAHLTKDVSIKATNYIKQKIEESRETGK